MIPGCYIAWGPWLDAECGPASLFKVGHTGDLRARLHDDCYVTGFPPDHWRFLRTFETKTKLEANQIESAVLRAFAARRLGSRELVRASLDQLVAAAVAAAECLSIAATPRVDPTYPRGGRALAAARAKSGDAVSNECLSPVQLAALDLLVSGPDVVADVAAPPEVLLPPAGTAVKDELAFADSLVFAGAEDVYGDDFKAERREYQATAVERCCAELDRVGRTTLLVACRCGKTKIASDIMRVDGARILYLVPGLSLLRQTARKLDMYGGLGRPAQLLLVGSDTRPLKPFRSFRQVGQQTTCPELIAAAVAAAGPDQPLVVVSTYQSSPLLPDSFDLIVFDEAHRTCGGTAPRPFNHALLTFQTGRRLYMTATPRYETGADVVSMKNRELFGGIAFAYRLREGIEAGYANPFQLTVLGGGTDVPMAQKVAVAAARAGVSKLLVFCRSIKHAETLAAEVALLVDEGVSCLTAHSRMNRRELAAALGEFAGKGATILFNCRLLSEGVEFPMLNAVFFASPRHSPRDVIQSLCRPLNVVPGKPASQVFIPAEFDEERSPEDPTNLKRFQTIVPIFDALLAEDERLYAHLFDPENCEYPLKWIDSAAAVCDVGGDEKAAPLRYSPLALLNAVRRSVRRGVGKSERLLRNAKIPWAVGFAELKRIVIDCRRYPKGNDTLVFPDGSRMNFGSYYRFVRENYAKWQAGEEQLLEPHQLRDLETLPMWLEFGVSGPYPFEQSLAFLDQWLADNSGVAPPIEVNCGGWIGLDASWLERLSGVLTTVNQGDGRDRVDRKTGLRRPGSGFTVSIEKQQLLDELCAKWNLRWRKERNPDKSLLEDSKGQYVGERTFVQEAFGRFKTEYKTRGKDSPFITQWFRGYPLKHKRQEHPDVWARRREIVPPKWRRRRA